MITFFARAFYDSTKYVSRIQVIGRELSKMHDGRAAGHPLSESMSGDLRREFRKLSDGCEILNCSNTDKLVKRSIARLDPGGGDALTIGELSTLVAEIASRFEDEIEAVRLFVLSPGDQKYYENAVMLFGDDVATSFPSALEDIEESGKCLALDRPTAAAFHLMRVLEVPLKTLAFKFCPNDPKPNWDPILRKIDAELKSTHKERTIQGNVDFYANVSVHMHAVKLAWRNRVNHIDDVVPPEKARDIFEATKAFMQYMSTYLRERT